jgi:hypothetical protein
MRAPRRPEFTMLTKAILASAAVATTSLSMLSIAQPAGADTTDPIPGYTCSASQNYQIAWAAPVLTVRPTVTQFSAFEVTPGSTGTHTVTLSTVHTVTRQVTNSVGVSISTTAEANVIFAKATATASATYNLSVVNSGSDSTTETDTITDTFTQPGRYGIYRGTYAVTGTDRTVECNRVSDLPPKPGDLYMWGNVRGAWSPSRGYSDGSTYDSFSMFTAVEDGTVSCGNTPIGAVAKAALPMLVC